MTQTNPLIEREFIAAEAAVCATRLAVGGLLWCVALALVDRGTFRASDPYVANLRWGLWLFLVEMLIGAYHVRYTAPASYPPVKRVAFVLAEVLSQAASFSVFVALNLVVRWLVLTLLTGAAVSLLGSGFLCRLVAFVPSGAFAVAWLSGLSQVGAPPVIRGTHLLSQAEAALKAAAITIALRQDLADRLRDDGMSDADPSHIQLTTFPFGGVDHGFTALDPHFLIVGTTDSGKSLSIKMLLASALMPLGERRNRAIVYDGKREYLPKLVGMGVPVDDIFILNPADARASAWNFAADITTRDDAMNIVRALIPDDPKERDNPFFPEALRAITVEVIMCLHSLNPKAFRLIDVLNAMRTLDVIRRVLDTTLEGRQTYERYITKAEETVGGITATIDARFINVYETIARAWSRTHRSVALTDWIQGNKILLLGYDANRAGVDRINQAVFQRAAQLTCGLLDDPDHKNELTWVVLDEITFTGKLPQAHELISFGRSKGVRMVLAPQDLDGLTEVYGEHATNALIGLCGNVGVLRLSSVKTREWAAKFFGEYEAYEIEHGGSTTETKSRGAQGAGSSTSHTASWTRRRTKRESILPSEFSALPQTNRRNGMQGFFATPAIGAWRAEVSPDYIDKRLPPDDRETPPFIPRPDFAVDPVRWTSTDERHFTTPKDLPESPSKEAPQRRETPFKDSAERPRDEKPRRNGRTPPSKDDLPDW